MRALQALLIPNFTYLAFLVPNLCSHNPFECLCSCQSLFFQPIILSLFDLEYILPTPVLLPPPFYSNATLWLIQSHRVICALSVLSSGSSPYSAVVTSTTCLQIPETTLFKSSNPSISFYLRLYGLSFTTVCRICKRI